MNPTPDQIVQSLPHVRYEIESFLLTPEYDRLNEALKESVYLRKVAHCRVLHTFFTRPRSKRQEHNPKDDDVLCEDFDFPIEQVYGEDPQALVDRFNKDLFHLTYTRTQRTPETKPWPKGWFPPIELQSRKFIDHILQTTKIPIEEAERSLWRKLKADDAHSLPLQQHTSNVAALRTERMICL